jgi:hypothetical protein
MFIPYLLFFILVNVHLGISFSLAWLFEPIAPCKIFLNINNDRIQKRFPLKLNKKECAGLRCVEFRNCPDKANYDFRNCTKLNHIHVSDNPEL